MSREPHRRHSPGDRSSATRPPHALPRQIRHPWETTVRHLASRTTEPPPTPLQRSPSPATDRTASFEARSPTTVCQQPRENNPGENAPPPPSLEPAHISMPCSGLFIGLTLNVLTLRNRWMGDAWNVEREKDTKTSAWHSAPNCPSTLNKQVVRPLTSSSLGVLVSCIGACHGFRAARKSGLYCFQICRWRHAIPGHEMWDES